MKRIEQSKKRLFITTISIVAICICLLSVYFSCESKFSTRSRTKSLLIGMSKNDAEKIVGLPPGNYAEGIVIPMAGVRPDRNTMIWIFEDEEIVLHFSQDVIDDIFVGKPTKIESKKSIFNRFWTMFGL